MEKRINMIGMIYMFVIIREKCYIWAFLTSRQKKFTARIPRR